jgi:sulfite dehydrogenase (cytochrome) subunit A
MGFRRDETPLDRRRFLRELGAGAALSASGLLLPRALAAENDPALVDRPLVRYPEKTDLYLLTSRPPQLETPMKYFEHAITPHEAFYVRYHLSGIPTTVDLSTWRLRVEGHVERPLQLSFDDLRTKFPPTKIVAVNQCSGNSRSRFEPRVFGGQWGDGAMGNAAWVGVRLQDILKAAGPKAGAVDATFGGLDGPPAPSIPDFAKPLNLSWLEGQPDVLVAYEMNGDELPMLNGFPARLVVPGMYATYWVKHLSEINVLDHAFDGFWMKTAYRIPDTPCGCVGPGTKLAHTVPINRMNVRSFIITPANGARVAAGKPTTLKGIAFDGGYGIRQVEISDDDGAVWRRAELGEDLGPYSFREWSMRWTPPRPGKHRLMVRATNRAGESQPFEPLWNPAGYLRNVIERSEVTAA